MMMSIIIIIIIMLIVIHEDFEDIGIDMRIEHAQKTNLLATPRVLRPAGARKVQQPGRRPHRTFDSRLLSLS